MPCATNLSLPALALLGAALAEAAELAADAEAPALETAEEAADTLLVTRALEAEVLAVPELEAVVLAADAAVPEQPAAVGRLVTPAGLQMLWA